MLMKEFVVLLSFMLLSIPCVSGFGVREVANSFGVAIHPIYIFLAYTVAPVLNAIYSFLHSIGISLIFTIILSPIGLFSLILALFPRLLELSISFGFPILYTVLGVLGKNPNFFIGSLGDLIGHFFVELGSFLAGTVLLLPLAAISISLGDLITLTGNGLCVLVVGHRAKAIQQFLGAAFLLLMFCASILNALACITVIWIPLAFPISIILVLLANFVAFGTDLTGHITTYFIRPIFSVCRRTKSI